MKIAIEGCAHGELDKIYEALQHLEKQEGIKIDLLICCGDFQATRNKQDLNCMAVPPKYRHMCSFYKYYSGEKKAPVLTLFIGGNHEASSHLQELGYGGWAAPHIYYLGCAGVVNFGGVRIGGLSGIYKGKDYMRGHYEKVPYTEDSKRSVYHIRNLEVFRLKQLSQPIDIMLSHDWPRGITDFGDATELLRRKPFFREDIEQGRLGSKPAEELLQELKPKYWFAAHLHCKFPAIVSHGPRKGCTKFLALDKCLPRRKFLQIISLDHDEDEPLQLTYDLEWLTILHLTNHLLSVKRGITYMPGPSEHERFAFTPTESEKADVLQRFDKDLRIPLNFSQTVVAYSAAAENEHSPGQPRLQLNPQTTQLCERLGVDDPLALLQEVAGSDTPGSCSFPSCLTPDRTGDLSHVSFTEDEDSPLRSGLDDSNISRPTNRSSSGSLLVKRLSMSLPPPKLGLPDESLEDSLSLSVGSQPSLECSQNKTPQASEESGLTNDTSVSDTNSSQHEPPDSSRSVKKFKRRNQAIYNTEED